METKNITNIAKKYGLSLITVFGSRARRDFRAGSDTDVAYISENNLSLEKESEFATDLTEVLKTKVDIVNVKKSTPLLSYKIFKEGKPLYEKVKGMFSDNLAKAYRIYEETMPLYKVKQALL